MENINFGQIADKFLLSEEFVQELYAKIVDKENFTRALKMYNSGLLSYDLATGNEPINIGELRKQIARNLVESRKKSREERVKQAMELQKRMVDYYSSCTRLTHMHKPRGTYVKDVVFIKDGHIVAFAFYEPNKGGIYAANNEVMPNFRWNPHQWLGRLRDLNKAFYRDVKKAAFADPKEWFDFQKHTH